MGNNVTNQSDPYRRPDPGQSRPVSGLRLDRKEAILPNRSLLSSLPGGKLLKISMLPLFWLMFAIGQPLEAADPTPLSELDVVLESHFLSPQKQDIFQISVRIPEDADLGKYLSAYIPIEIDGNLAPNTLISAILINEMGEITTCQVEPEIQDPNLFTVQAELSKNCRSLGNGGFEYHLVIELANSGLTPGSPQSKVSFASGGWVMIDNIQIDGLRDLGNTGLLDYSNEGSGYIGSGNNHGVGNPEEGTYNPGEGGIVIPEELGLREDEISFGPNPFGQRIIVQTQGSVIQDLLITDMGGKIVFQKTGNRSHLIEVSTEQFAKGMYLVRVRTQEGVQQVKRMMK